MIGGVIAAAILAFLVGINIHHHDTSKMHHQQRQVSALKKEVKQLKKHQLVTPTSFYGDEMENLGEDNVK